MLIKIFSLTFDSLLGGFDDRELRSFLQDKEVLSVRDHLFIRNEIPYLTLVVKYLPYRKEAEAKSQDQQKPRDEAWKAILTDADLGLFNLLRDWRSQRSKKDGLPPYVLFTNQQLAMIVKARPQTIADLGTIDGIGRGKIEKFGQDILRLRRHSSDPPIATILLEGEALDCPASEN